MRTYTKDESRMLIYGRFFTKGKKKPSTTLTLHVFIEETYAVVIAGANMFSSHKKHYSESGVFVNLKLNTFNSNFEFLWECIGADKFKFQGIRGDIGESHNYPGKKPFNARKKKKVEETKAELTNEKTKEETKEETKSHEESIFSIELDISSDNFLYSEGEEQNGAEGHDLSYVLENGPGSVYNDDEDLDSLNSN